jgi:TatD DNase family protein
MLIDSHVNLHAPQFAEDQAEVIAGPRGRRRPDADHLRQGLVLRGGARHRHGPRRHLGHVGTHPHEAKENPHLTAEDLVELAGRPKVVGIGECGLDFHYDWSPRDVQAQVFRAHCRGARETGLPLIVHTREADGRWATSSRTSTPAARFRS